MPDERAFQDHYNDDVAHCYGCGRLNEHGLGIRSFWDGDETVCRFVPRPWHTALPGFVYGGLLASLIDCHATGSAAAAGYRAEGRAMGTEPPLRYVTAALKVDYLAPNPPRPAARAARHDPGGQGAQGGRRGVGPRGRHRNRARRGRRRPHLTGMGSPRRAGATRPAADPN